MGNGKQSFERQFAEALRRRLYPSSSLRLKMVSQDTGYSEDTISRWLKGKHRVFAGAVEDMASYFATRYDDHGLLRELFDVPAIEKQSPLTEGEPFRIIDRPLGLPTDDEIRVSAARIDGQAVRLTT